MNRSKLSLAWLAGSALLAGACASGWADAKLNPYDLIVERNPFGLKPPPPAPDPNEVNKPPPTPPATVELTGITSILTSKRALLEIVPGPGKPMIKPILAEGERIESVEVVSINVEKNEVTVRNGNLVTNLTFKVAKSAPTPATPVPGMVPPPVVPPVIPPVQTSYNQNPSGTGRNNVMVGGGSPATPASTTPAYGGVNPALGGVNPGIGANSATLSGGANGGFRSIPSRNIRTTTPQPAAPQMSREEQYLQIENNRLINEAVNQASGKRVFPPLPPTPYTPPGAPGLPPLPGETR